MKRLAHIFVDDGVSDDVRFGEVREKAFRIVPREELCIKVANPNEAQGYGRCDKVPL